MGIEKKFDSEISYDLVDDFINWYQAIFIKGQFPSIYEYHLPNRMRDNIEKMAVWYELKFPKEEVLKQFSNRSFLKIDNTLSIKKYLDSLSNEDKWFLFESKYINFYYLDNQKRINYFLIDELGTIISSRIYKKNSKEIYYNFNKQNIIDTMNFLRKKNYSLPTSKELEQAIIEYKNKKKLTNKFFEAVMFKIVNRGGSIVGARRAFMFAKDFNISTDTALIYGVDYLDENLKDLIKLYLKDGGSNDLKCLVGYNTRKKENEPLPIMTIEQIANTKNKQKIKTNKK